MECYIREYLGYRKLKAPSKGDILIDYNYWYGKEREIITNIYKMDLDNLIYSEVLKYLEKQQILKDALLKKKKDEYVEPEEKIEIKFNKEEFAKIREKSEEIQKALIVEEESQEENASKEQEEYKKEFSVERKGDNQGAISNDERERLPKVFIVEKQDKNKESTIDIKEQEIKQVAERFETKQKIINEELKTIQTTTNEEKMPAQAIVNEESMQTQTIPNEELIPVNTEKSEESNVFKEFTYNLTEPEKEILHILLQKENVENKMFQIAQNHNEMLEVMVSNINDKALDTIGDTIIESDMASIYEDYENEIKQVL